MRWAQEEKNLQDHHGIHRSREHGESAGAGEARDEVFEGRYVESLLRRLHVFCVFHQQGYPATKGRAGTEAGQGVDRTALPESVGCVMPRILLMSDESDVEIVS